MEIRTIFDQITLIPETDPEREYVEFMFQAMANGGKVIVEHDGYRKTFEQVKQPMIKANPAAAKAKRREAMSKDLLREMTPEEADAEYDTAPSIPISDEEIERMVKAATEAKPMKTRANHE